MTDYAMAFGTYADVHISFDGETVGILFARAVGGKITHVAETIPLVFAQFQEGNAIEPTLTVTRHLGQSLLDALWRAGIRPTFKPINERDLIPPLMSALEAWIRAIAHGYLAEDTVRLRGGFADRLHALVDDICAGQKHETEIT